MLDRGDYWQCAYVIPKGGIDAVHARACPAFQQNIVELALYLRDRAAQPGRLGQDRTARAHRQGRPPDANGAKPGLLCIGDAAHAMSPIGGVGINLAVQDAIASANLLAAPLTQRARLPSPEQLKAVQAAPRVSHPRHPARSR